MLELTTSVILLVTSLYGGPVNVAVAQDVADSANTHNKTAIEYPVTLEGYVRNYFIETPILADIAKCESMFRQFNTDGSVLRGRVNKSDVGLLQINEAYHEEKAVELGLDLETVDGNLAYAQYLYDHEGTRPWNASKKCWK